MTVSLHPNTDLVAVAWLKLAAPGYGVATSLPSDTSALRTSGFVQTRTVGGSPDMYVPMRSPVVSVTCWAAPSVQGSDKVPWGRANNIAELIVAATYDRSLTDVDVTLPGDFPPAHVHTVIALSEPRRIEDDPANFARFDVDLVLNWTAR